MPELPEVETIRNNLRQGAPGQPALLGKTITGVELFWPRSLAMPGPDEFQARLASQTIQEIGRRGKYLLIHLSQDTLIIHLRMSGDLLVEPDASEINPYHRLVIRFADGLRLAFNDTRKFGRVWLTADPQTVLEKLGPEPFDPALTPPVFYERLNATRRQLKPLLLDQAFLAGLGNIYTDEALNLAGLHPLVLSNRLSFEQADRLLYSIRSVLQEGIRRHGASIDWVYRGGDFQNYFRVYHRTGLPCPTCGKAIQKITVGQRGTHFCPDCQPNSP